MEIDIFGNPIPPKPRDAPIPDPVWDNGGGQTKPVIHPLGQPPGDVQFQDQIQQSSQGLPPPPLGPKPPYNPTKPSYTVDPRNDPNSPFFGGPNALDNFLNNITRQWNQKVPLSFGGMGFYPFGGFPPYNPYWGVPMFQPPQPQLDIGALVSGLGSMFVDTLSRIPQPQINIAPASVPGFTAPALNYAGNAPQPAQTPIANQTTFPIRPTGGVGGTFPLGLYGALLGRSPRPPISFGSLFY